MTLAGERARPRPVFSPTIDAVVRESPCDIAVVKQRGLDQVESILVPVRGGPHAELAMRISRDLAKRFGAKVVVLHVVPKGIGDRAIEREQAAVDAFVREHAGTRRATGPHPRGDQRAPGDHQEAANHELVVMGASAQPTNAQPGRALPVRHAGGVGRHQGEADRHRGQDQAVAGAGHLRGAARQRGHARPRRCVRRAQPIAAGGRRQVVRREHLPRARVRRHPQARGAQGATQPDDQRRPAGAQRGEDDRDGHQAREGRADGPGAADRPDRGHRLRQRPIARSRSPPSWACRCTGTREILPETGTHTRQGRGAVEEPPRARRRHRGLDRHRHQQHPAALRVRAARTAARASRRSSTSRASTSARSARATSCRPRAAVGSPS